jgi:hypothetical protein
MGGGVSFTIKKSTAYGYDRRSGLGSASRREGNRLRPLEWNTSRNVCPNLHKVSKYLQVHFCEGSHLYVPYGTLGPPFAAYGLCENAGQQSAFQQIRQLSHSGSKSVLYLVKRQ